MKKRVKIFGTAGITWFAVFAGVLLIGLGGGRAQPVSAKAGSTAGVDSLVQVALEQNPNLRAALEGWRASEARIPQAGALPDPTVAFSLANLPVNSFAFDQEPMTGKKISVTQMFPFPGKLGLKENIARFGAEMQKFKYEELKNQLAKQVKQAYFSLFAVDKAIEIVEKNQQLMREFVKIAQTKYSVGKGLQQDVLKAQVELSRLGDRLISLRQRRDDLQAKLNALLNRPPRREIPVPGELEFRPVSFSYGKLRALVVGNRPLLQAWQSFVQQNQQKLRLARNDYLPNFTLGVAYTQRDVLRSGMGGVDYFSGTVGLSVPLYFWRKQSKKVEEMQLGLSAAELKLDDVRNQVLAQLESALSAVEKNQQLVELYKTGILPQASQSLQAAISGYQTDKVDFLTLLNNQITLFNYELQYYRVLADFRKSLAELEWVVGLPAERLVNR